MKEGRGATASLVQRYEARCLRDPVIVFAYLNASPETMIRLLSSGHCVTFRTRYAEPRGLLQRQASIFNSSSENSLSAPTKKLSCTDSRISRTFTTRSSAPA